MIDADNFKKAGFYYVKQFELILGKIVHCYGLMLKTYSSIENNENLIRNRLHKDFLDNNDIRKDLCLFPFLFDIEQPEIDSNYAEKGRTDIKVYNAIKRLMNTNAYYVIECKRLDGSKSYNRKYIEEGIRRFVIKKYPSYYSINGMIGFIVASIETDKNIKKINELVDNEYPDIKMETPLTKMKFIKDFDFSYISIHFTVDGNKLKLYHVMLDFSKLIRI